MPTLTKPRIPVTEIAKGITQAKLSPRVLLIYDHPRDNHSAYLGFEDIRLANRCLDWFETQGIRRYERKADTGLNKPRRAERTGCCWEIKWHRPQLDLLSPFVQKDQAR
jgi:hypothetical protein